MSNLTFRGAFIRFADLRQKEEAGIFARLHFTSDLSDPVREALGWEVIPECVNQTKLQGELTGRHLILTPNDKALRQHEIQMEVTEASDFQLFRVKDGDGEIEKEELRFIARVVEPFALDKVERYLRVVGTAPGALKITYEVQEKLDLDPEQAKQGTLATDGQEPIEATLTGDALAAHPAATSEAAGPTLLPSAREMGGTHQRGRKRNSDQVQ